MGEIMRTATAIRCTILMLVIAIVATATAGNVTVNQATNAADNFLEFNESVSGWDGADPMLTEEHVLPQEYSLRTAYPNPFNPSTSITVSLPEAVPLNVLVYNVMGQRVAILADGRYPAGLHRLTFDASNLSSGVYFIHAAVPGHLNQVQKIMLVR